MNEQNNFDKWLNKSLENYRPVPDNSSRQRFLSEAGSSSKSGISGTNLIIGLLTVILFSSVAIYELYNRDNTSLKYYPASVMAMATEPYDTKKVINENNKQNTAKTRVASQSLAKSKNITAQINKDELLSDDDKFTDSKDQSVSGYNPSVTAESAFILNKDEDQTEKESFLTIDTTNAEVTDIPVDSSTLIQTPTELKKENKNQADEPPLYNRTLFIYYRPEYLWNIIETGKFTHNFGLEWQTRLFNGRYVLGTGLGLSLNKGYYEYGIDYKEYLGDYMRLDSVTFDWNPGDFTMQYSVHTTEEQVFDTAIKTSYEKVYRKFVYVQLPLILGYDFINKEKTTLGVRFVPVISLLVSKKPLDFTYDAGKNKVIQINRITADRVNSNWQLNTGMVYGRRLSSSLRLEIEPRFTYYFNSVFEKSDNSVSPMGASIRVALGFRY